MNTTSNKLIAILSIVAVGLAVTTASAKDKGNGGNNGGGSSNRSLSIGGNSSNKSLSIGGNNSNKSINIGSIINKSSNSNNSSNNNSNSNNNNNSNSNKKKSSIAIGIGIGLANSNFNNNYNKKPCYDGHCYNTTYVHKIYVPVYTCFRPLHCFAWVLPGDTWTTISLREYHNPNLFAAIAAFNGLSLNVPLVVGQQIGLPEIHPNGVLKVSFAPAPAPLMLPAQAMAPMGSPAFPINMSQNLINANVIGGPQAPIGTAGAIGPQGTVMQGVAPQGLVGLPNAGAIGTANAAGLGNATSFQLPSFAVGSVIALDGQTLGSAAGSARLKFAGVALSANVIEWTASLVKIQLPAVDLTAAMGAELEVLRADGSLAIKTSLELTPATNKLALGN